MGNEIRLSKPSVVDRRNVISLFKKILDNGFFVQGKYVSDLERIFSNYLKSRHAIAVSSGTAALHLSLLALGLKKTDEVIVPAYTFPATANVIEIVGAKPVIIDVDINTYNIDTRLIEKYITRRTKAIIVVHIFGNPANMTEIMKIARKHGIYVIEDAAGALGSKFKGTNCGTIGDIGCFSFHPRKIVTTGEGGMIVTDNEDFAEKILMLRNHGIRRTHSETEIVLPGFNYRMNEFEAILGIAQMKKIECLIRERQRLARIYRREFSKMRNIKCQVVSKNSTNSWQAFVIRLLNVHRTDCVIKKMKEKGIEVNLGTYAIHLLKYYREKYKIVPSDYPNATSLYYSSLAVPFYNGLRETIIKKVVKSLKEVLYEI